MAWNYNLDAAPPYELVAVLLKPWRKDTYVSSGVWASEQLHDESDPEAGHGVWIKDIDTDEQFSSQVIAWAPLPKAESWSTAEAKVAAAREPSQ